MDDIDRNCLSYWFPKLAAAAIPVPRTEIVRTSLALIGLVDESYMAQLPAEIRPTPERMVEFRTQLQDAAMKVDSTGPWFLRTGHFSGKHNWKNTCDLRKISTVLVNVNNLVRMSEEVAMFGELPYQVWCVRRRLKVKPFAFLPKYGDMPVVREYRAFIRGGRIVCAHPYWPLPAIQDGLVNPDDLSCATGIWNGMYDRAIPTSCYNLALGVAEVFNGDGDWSVDLLEDEGGDWYVTDMALAHRSWHDDTCWLKDKFKKPEAKA